MKPFSRPISRKRLNSSGLTQRFTGRWLRVGCRYWPRVRMSTPMARRSSMVSMISSSVSPRPSIRLVLVSTSGRWRLACSSTRKVFS
ncbi:hypothetical protein D9M71_500580 [compost metagenome]